MRAAAAVSSLNYMALTISGTAGIKLFYMLHMQLLVLL